MLRRFNFCIYKTNQIHALQLLRGRFSLRPNKEGHVLYNLAVKNA